MAFNFPTTPAEGYQWWWGEGLPTWIYRGGMWIKRAGTALAKNYLVNPAFQISDQNGLTDVSNQTNIHLAEQWTNQYISSVGTVRSQRVAEPTPGGGSHRLRLSMTVGDPTLTGDWLVVGTILEGNRMAGFNYGTADAKWSVLRFGCKAPAGTYCVAFRNNGVTRSFVSPFTVPAGLANQDHVQIMVFPPCYDGVWPTDNTIWGYIQWIVANASMTSSEWQWLSGNYAGGTSLTNTFMQTAGNTFEIFDPGFYLDPNVTAKPPEYEVPDYVDAQQDCLRYWCRVKGLRGVVTTATQARVATGLPVYMRVSPSTAMIGTQRIYDSSAAPNITSISNAILDSYHVEIFVTSTGLTVGRPAQLLVDGQETGYIACSARM
jgi:hypothetical protein